MLRAPKQGTCTRAVTANYKKSKTRPLSFNQQIHPQRKDPLPRNPGCSTNIQWMGLASALAKKHTMQDFLDGVGLESTVRSYRLLSSEGIEYFTDDINYAMAFSRAARFYGVWYDVIAN